jgi:hypothetical protein
MLGYVYRLAHRMQRMGWKPDDAMYVAAWDAYYALHALHVHARYASCKPGTGRRSEVPRVMMTRRAGGCRGGHEASDESETL